MKRKSKALRVMDELNESGQRALEREVIKKKERIQAAADLVVRFNTKHPDSLVYLKLTQYDSASFHVHFKLDDQFINSENYDEGTAVIYPSEKLFEEIQKLAGDVLVHWNNTRSTGWLNIY